MRAERRGPLQHRMARITPFETPKVGVRGLALGTSDPLFNVDVLEGRERASHVEPDTPEPRATPNARRWMSPAFEQICHPSEWDACVFVSLSICGKHGYDDRLCAGFGQF